MLSRVGRAQEGRMNGLNLLIQELAATLWLAVILNLTALGKTGETQCRPEQLGRPQRTKVVTYVTTTSLKGS